jgi:hypothetical protein
MGFSGGKFHDGGTAGKFSAHSVGASPTRNEGDCKKNEKTSQAWAVAGGAAGSDGGGGASGGFALFSFTGFTTAFTGLIRI